MRLATLRLLSALALFPATALASPAQAPFPAPPRTASTTIIDVLGQDPDYTSLLRLLQRAKLIPTINRLNGSTLFAPTNDAIDRHSASNSLWQHALAEDALPLLDNVRERLRQQLLYHLLNYTLALPDPHNDSLVVTRTLHFPYVITEPPTDQPPPRPPWMPVPGGGTLGGEPQRLRVASRGEQVRVGVDAFGKGGVKVVKSLLTADNGIVVGVNGVLDPPSHLVDVVASEPSLSYFLRILTPQVKDRLANTSELTLFVPVDAAFDELPKYERLFLESEFAGDDLQRIFDMHAVVQENVTYSESFNPGLNLTTLQGQTLEVVTAPDKVLVSGAQLVQPDIYGANGVLHTVSSLLISSGSLQLTPEKLLLTYNCTSFISLLHSVNLTSLINNTESKYTILAPQDDVISLFGEGDLPEKGSDALQKALQYHFLPGKWTQEKLHGLQLLETQLTEDGLDGGRQVIQVEVNAKDKADIESSASIRFGGASVVGEPLEVNNTLIYFISRPLTPPADAMAVALPSLDLSNFLAAVFSAELADTIKSAPRSTLLVPHNDGFKRLGTLVSSHLLSAASKQDLSRVVLHHVLEGVFYSSDLTGGPARTAATLEGSDVHIERKKNGSLILTGSGGWSGMSSVATPKNMLTRTGVVHELSDVLLPRSLDLTLGKLVKAAQGTTMTSLVTRAGMDWILNGTAPPEDSDWAKNGVKGTGWTLLCPSDDAFKHINLTALYADSALLQAIVAQHLIYTPTPDSAPDVTSNRPLALGDKTAYRTLLSPESEFGDVVFRTNETGGVVVGIKNARGTGARADWANVIAWGRATTGGGSGGVVQIDHLIMPYAPPWWIAYGAPAFVGGLGVIAIAGFFAIVRLIWRRDAREATYEPVGGFVNDDDDS